MSRQLCVGRDPEWWTPGHEQARLAALICRRCIGCLDDDPKPHGVIRHGVAYSDNGAELPDCPACQRPNVADHGGPRSALCKTCTVGELPIPSRHAVSTARRGHAVALTQRGFSDEAAAFEAGLSPATVRNARQAAGHKYPNTGQPKTFMSTPTIERTAA